MAEISKNRPVIFGIVFGGLFVATGLLLCIFGMSSVAKSWRTLGWEAADARIVSVDIVRKDMPSSPGKTSCLRFLPVVKYSYEVYGGRYSSNRITENVEEIDCGDMTYAQEIVGQYHPGETKEIYFDPDNPADSVMEKEGSIAALLFIFVGIVLFMLPGAYFMHICIGILKE